MKINTCTCIHKEEAILGDDTCIYIDMQRRGYYRLRGIYTCIDT